MLRYTIILLLIGAFLLGAATNALACKCQGNSTVAGSLKSADIVFSGEVISRKFSSNYDSLGVKLFGDTTDMMYKWAKFPSAVIRIKVESVFKGKTTAKIITILTPARSASCGIYFEVGSKYIVYANNTDELINTKKFQRKTTDNKTFWTHLCTRTQYWNKQEEAELKKI